MISGGAAFTFSLLALIAGIAIGMTLRPATRHRTRVGREWGEIDQAADDTYRAVHDAIGEIRARQLLPCECHGDELVPYCPRHTPLPGEAVSGRPRRAGVRVELESGIEVQLAAPYDQERS